MEINDDDLCRFATEAASPLAAAEDQGTVEHDGARIWCATYGSGRPVILLHGGPGHSGNWGYAEDLARTIPDAELIELACVSHFAPLQSPEQFISAMLGFLKKVIPDA